jgi:hypothetical protein
MRDRSFEVRKAWKFSGRHRVLRLDLDWLGGSEYVIVQRLDNGALLLRPARDVKDDGEAVRLENQLNAEVAIRDA